MHRELPVEIQRLICLHSDRAGLQCLRQVSGLWRYLSLPLLWRSIEISDWEDISSAQDIYATYGRYVQTIEYRRIRRRRGNSHNASASASLPAVDSRTKTQVLCEWFGRRWEGLHQVTVGAWPPYNVYRIQEAIAASCPRLKVLVLEGAAAAWVDTLQCAIAAHPNLVGLHITEDARALLPPAADGPYTRTQSRFNFLECGSRSGLTHLTVPCLADSVILLLSGLARLLPALTSLDLRQVDSGVAGHLRVSLPHRLMDLKIRGQHPLSLRMLGVDYADTHLEYRAAQRWLSGMSIQELAPGLRSLIITGPRSEEAARNEHEAFWSTLFQIKLPSLAKLVIPVAHPELGSMISQMCPALKHLQFMHAGSAIYPQQNTQWASQLTKLAYLRHLDIASSNNEYEGCILSSELATRVSWNTPWLRTLYMSRIRLSTQALETLLSMLPHLYALWFTFDATPTHACDKNNQFDTILPTSRRLRYLIIHAIYTSASAYLLEPVEPRVYEGQQAPSSSTLALAACLDRLPTLNRCRLPMFTYPDTHRHWLRNRYLHIDFNKYAPPY